MRKTNLALAVTSVLGASAANAAIMAEYANAVLVPWVRAEATDPSEVRGTAIALNSCAAGTVYWAFYNAGSVKQIDSQFPMTKNDQRSFLWNDPEFGGDGFLDEDGYMIFFLDTNDDVTITPGEIVNNPDGTRTFLGDSTCLAGNAFFVDTQANDVAFVPTYPMNLLWGDFVGGLNLIQIDGVADITGLWAGAREGDTMHLRYFVDGAPGGDDTTIYIWSATSVFTQPGRGSYFIQQYDNTQTRFSLRMDLFNPELNVLNPETNDNFSVPSRFKDGFYEWVIDDRFPDFDMDGIVSWSVVTSPRFQATQTVLNPVFKPHISNGNDILEQGERFSIFERYNPEGDDPSDDVGDALDEGFDVFGVGPGGGGAGVPCSVIHPGEECPNSSD